MGSLGGCFLLSLVLSSAYGFYVPRVAPKDFHQGDLVEIKAMKLTSVKAQLPYEYYSMPFCRPKSDKIIYQPDKLGEVLRIVNTPFEVHMNSPQGCTVLCNEDKGSTFTEKESQIVAQRIKQGYNVHLITDNLPCATKFELLDTGESQYEHGYKLGFVKDNKAYINNHLKLILKYHTEDDVKYRVVGFEVEPMSIQFGDLKVKGNSCQPISKGSQGQDISEESSSKVMFTYEVTWEKSEIRWASRWDTYLTMSDVQIHWFSIINSVVVVFFLAGILTMIIVRTLRRVTACVT